MIRKVGGLLNFNSDIESSEEPRTKYYADKPRSVKSLNENPNQIKQDDNTENTRIFGVKLATAVKRAPHKKRSTMPSCFVNAIDFINKKALNEEGLYRIPGNKRLVDQYKDEIDRGIDIDFLNDVEKKIRMHEAHDLCLLIRTYLLSLPESIFTEELQHEFQLKQFGPDPDDAVELPLKIQLLKRLIKRLPQINQDTLQYFILHLTKIATNSSVNQMTAMNLVISMFGMSAHTRAYYLLIKNYDQIFEAPIIQYKKSIDEKSVQMSVATLRAKLEGNSEDYRSECQNARTAMNDDSIREKVPDLSDQDTTKLINSRRSRVKMLQKQMEQRIIQREIEKERELERTFNVSKGSDVEKKKHNRRKFKWDVKEAPKMH
jgi:hypothetical protein